jgi:transposase
MVEAFGSHDWRDRKLREWLLLLLRFAVTREPSDRSAVLAMSDELDSLAQRWRPAAPSFFLRTSNEICRAILTGSDGYSNAVLQKHISRIDDPRLRRAFQAAVGLHQTLEPQPEGAKRRNRTDRDLWRGLP